MKGIYTFMIAGPLMAACSGGLSAAQQAEQEFDIVSRSGTNADRCEAMRKVAAAWLSEGNQERYETARVMRNTYCLSAELNANLGLPDR